MTLKQERLVKEVINGKNKTLREAGIKAGYSNISRNIYKKNTKRYISKILEERGVDKESLTEVFKGIKDLALQKGDLSNANRSIENIARLYNLLKDSNIQQVAIFNDPKVEEDVKKIIDDVTTSNSKD